MSSKETLGEAALCTIAYETGRDTPLAAGNGLAKVSVEATAEVERSIALKKPHSSWLRLPR